MAGNGARLRRPQHHSRRPSSQIRRTVLRDQPHGARKRPDFGHPAALPSSARDVATVGARIDLSDLDRAHACVPSPEGLDSVDLAARQPACSLRQRSICFQASLTVARRSSTRRRPISWSTFSVRLAPHEHASSILIAPPPAHRASGQGRQGRAAVAARPGALRRATSRPTPGSPTPGSTGRGPSRCRRGRKDRRRYAGRSSGRCTSGTVGARRPAAPSRRQREPSTHALSGMRRDDLEGRLLRLRSPRVRRRDYVMIYLPLCLPILDIHCLELPSEDSIMLVGTPAFLAACMSS